MSPQIVPKPAYLRSPFQGKTQDPKRPTGTPHGLPGGPNHHMCAMFFEGSLLIWAAYQGRPREKGRLTKPTGATRLHPAFGHGQLDGRQHRRHVALLQARGQVQHLPWDPPCSGPIDWAGNPATKHESYQNQQYENGLPKPMYRTTKAAAPNSAWDCSLLRASI